MSIVRAGTVLGFSSDSLDKLGPALKEKAAEIGKFIPKVGASGNQPTQAVKATVPNKAPGFVDGFKERRAKALAQASARPVSPAARSRESYVNAIKNRAVKSLPDGAVESVAQFILNAAKAGGEALNTAAEMYRACFLDTGSRVSQTARGDFQDDNKGVA